MSKPGTIYKAQWKDLGFNHLDNSALQSTILVYIYDMENLIDDSASEKIIDLELADKPLTISITDNAEDKFTPIKAKQIELQIYSSSSIDLSTFASGGDNRWKVKISINDEAQVIFYGFLSMSDSSMEFQPDPNLITLTATDNLGILKDVALTDFDGEFPKGWHKIKDFICWALSKTGLELELWVINNIREETLPTTHLYEGVYLNAWTFEKEDDEREDCYTVLKKILGESCYLSQQKGRWYIMNVDEFDDNYIYVSRFDTDGSFIEHQYADSTQWKRISIDDQMSWFGYPDTPPQLSLERAYKYIKETYNFDTPKEIPLNRSLTRGDIYTPLNMPDDRVYYHAEDWTYEKNGGGSTSSLAYIVKVYEDINATYEKERYLSLTRSNDTGIHQLISSRIPVHKGDKFDFSVDRRLSKNFSGSGYTTEHFAQIRLYGSNGSYWTIGNVDGLGQQIDPTTQQPIKPSWVQSNSSFTTNNRYVSKIYPMATTNEMDWMTASLNDISAIPVDGELEILLLRAQQSTYYQQADTHFANISFTYIPLLNGAYSKYKGLYYKISQDLDTRAARDEQVYISDCIKKLFKGAMFKLENGSYVPCEKFYAANVFPNGVPAWEYLHTYAHIQAWSVWNQFNRVMSRFEGTIDSVDADSTDNTGYVNIPDIFHKYYLGDAHKATTNKYFMLHHYEQDFFLNEWTAYFSEVYDTQIGKVYDDTLEIKYIGQ